MNRETEKLKNENAVFKFIQKFISENGYAPCVREVCKACNIKQVNPYSPLKVMKAMFLCPIISSRATICLS